ncbi:unnamed protein product [Acanthoscelides obtectus]|uniref:C2H2-type domain-containing protein n=1 Tax=Acanthoscelides obtectus TaxID=200917 RepID=A0A9P0M403_ACAOB|nr:unnamed protein product [Acanthoscelides obtectus]CAK1670569.1 Zinc finger protein 26 [Acanthoscelides obtectus]
MSFSSTLQSIKDERWDGVNQVKMENQLVVSVKSETPEAEQTLNNTKLENMDTLMLNEEFDIKYECADAIFDRIKVEEKLEPGLEADSTADTVNQMKMEFQESDKLEEKPDLRSTNLENMYALGLHHGFDIKTESDQSDEHDSASDRLPIKKTPEKEQRNPPIEEHYIQTTFKCTNCDASFNTKRRVENHILQRHPKFAAPVSSKSSKIRECTHCEYKTTFPHCLTSHMMKHTGAKLKCTECDASFTSKQSLDDHILRKHPEFTTSLSSKIHKCTHCEYQTIYAHSLARHIFKHTGAKLKCTKCDKSFTYTQSLDDHILRKHPDLTASVSRKIQKCTHCEYKCLQKQHLIRHMMKHTGDKLKCTKCDASFTTRLSLDDHNLRKHPEFTTSVSRKIHKCTHCEYQTIYAHSLARHIIKHTGAKLKCTECDALFTSKQSLDDHILRKHPEFTTSVSSKIHKCTHCEYKCLAKQQFIKHMMKHTGAKLKCTKCEALFISKRSLDNHILRKHPEFSTSVSHKIHKCTHCEYKTTHAYSLAIHIIKHTGAKLKCTKCDKSFTTIQSLDDHILQKHPEFTTSVSSKIHKCTHCDYKTTYKEHLVNHMMERTGAKLKCTKCDKSFITTKSLNNHFLQKHPELATSISRKIHECTHCEYKTTYKDNLAGHMMKHTGAKLKCTKCDKSFTYTQSLDDHILQKHPGLTASVSRKIHKCTHCEYKSLQKRQFIQHMMKHTGAKLKCTK